MGLIDVPECMMRNPLDCGPAVARSVLRYYERPVMRVDQICKAHPDGTDPEKLVSLFLRSRLGVAARPHMTLNHLSLFCEQLAPVVVAVTWTPRKGHWVLVRGIRDGCVYLMDPESGYCEVPADDFIGAWHDTTIDGEKLEHFGLAVFPTPTL